MKITKLRRNVVIMILTVLSFSCQEQEDECFSCDNSIDAWAHENITLIRDMNRYDISKLTGAQQRAAFRVLSPEKRKDVWLDKLEHIKDIVDNDDEKEFINELISKANDTDFSREWTESQIEANNDLLFEAANRFNWGMSFIVYAFGTLGDIDFNDEASNSFFGQETVDCNCKWGWCPDNSDCETSTCEETNLGCGLFNLGSCTKRCGGDPGGGIE